MIARLINLSIVSLLVFITSGSSVLFNWTIKIPLLFVVAALVLKRKNAVTNKEFFFKMSLYILIWITINFLSYIFTMTPFVTTAVILFTTNFILALMVLHLLGWSFWINFEKIIYYLTLLSLPIFLLNVLMPSFFDNLISVFKPFTNERFFQFDEFRNYWSAIVYVKAMKTDFLYRNCGFMWEPGAFAMIIIWGLGFNWLINGIKIDRRTIVYSIALITTQSTAGYIAFFIMLIAANMKNMKLINFIFIIVIAYFFFVYVYDIDFIGEKVDGYLYYATNDIVIFNKFFNAYKVNRIQILQYDLIRLFKYPLGYGFNYQGDFISVNGLSSTLLMWGIIPFIYFLVLIRKYYTQINIYSASNKVVFLIYTGLLIMFFSNPISQNVFFYMLVGSPLILKKCDDGQTKQYL